jgi:hypothetical protein
MTPFRIYKTPINCMMILVNIDMKAPLHPDETFFLKKRSYEICLGCRLIYYDNKFAARLLVATIILTWKNLYMNYMLG